MTDENVDITGILRSVEDGDDAAFEQLITLVYGDLRTLAGKYLRGAPPSQTLQATALVNETCLKMMGQTRKQWENRAHFFNAAARGMRQTLVDHARRRARRKRGGDWQRRYPKSLDGIAAPAGLAEVDLVALDEALKTLAEIDENQARTVELRFFGGLSLEEVAKILGVTTRTVQRYSTDALEWLKRELAGP